MASQPGLVAVVRRGRPALVVRAAVDGGDHAVRLAAGLGFDVNARGRTDAPLDEPWETALHHAAHTGDEALARTLLALGADPSIRDARFNATPLGWARHAGQARLVTLLDPVTPP